MRMRESERETPSVWFLIERERGRTEMGVVITQGKGLRWPP